MGKWVTIKGAHVYIEDDGSITKGPKDFVKKVKINKDKIEVDVGNNSTARGSYYNQNGKTYLKAKTSWDLAELTKYKGEIEKEINKNHVKTSSVLNNRKNLVNYVKQQTDIDLEEAATKNQFAPRRGLNIDSSKMTINELNDVKRIMIKKDIRIESNGIKDYFIYYEKKK